MIGPANTLKARPRRIMLGAVAVAIIVPIGALLAVLAGDDVCGRAITAAEQSQLRGRGLMAWLVSLGVVGIAVLQVRRCGYSALDRRILWGIFGIWKLMALGFVLSVGVPCWEMSEVPGALRGSVWVWPAMIVSFVTWLALVFSLVVLIVVGPRDAETA